MKPLVSEELDACGISVEKSFYVQVKGAKREWFEKVYDYALACNSLKNGKYRRWWWWKILSRGRTKRWSFVVENEESTCRNETSRSCLATVEEGCQGVAQNKKAEKESWLRTMRKTFGIKTL